MPLIYFAVCFSRGFKIVPEKLHPKKNRQTFSRSVVEFAEFLLVVQEEDFSRRFPSKKIQFFFTSLAGLLNFLLYHWVNMGFMPGQHPGSGTLRCERYTGRQGGTTQMSQCRFQPINITKQLTCK